MAVQEAVGAMALALGLIAGCGNGGSSSTGSGQDGPPFVWDAGPDSSLACAVLDCLSYVTGQCPSQAANLCSGVSTQMNGSTNVCFKSGAREVLTMGAASVDAVVYGVDGSVCMHELSDTSGLVQWVDTAGRVLATANLQSNMSFTCGGYATDSLRGCTDDAGWYLASITACETLAMPGPCP